MQIEPKTTYNKDNLAIYQYDLDENEVEQLRRLTDDDNKIQISQINVSYVNTFDDTWTFKMKFETIALNITYIDPADGQTVITLTGQSLTPKKSTYYIPLTCQTTNQLLNFLNQPLYEYQTTISGVDYTCDLVTEKWAYWDTYNGKLRFTQSNSGQIILTSEDGSTIIKTTLAQYASLANFNISVYNFYYANQIMGVFNGYDIVNIISEYGHNTNDVYYYYDTYQVFIRYGVMLQTLTIDKVNYYPLKEFYAKLEFYQDTSSILQAPYFLQMFKELYVLTNLQTEDMIYKKNNISFLNSKNLITYDMYELDNSTPRTQIYNNIYKTFIQLPCIAYYINSVSFNNAVNIKNTYPLQFMRENQYYTIQSLKHMEFILVDEHGVILPNLQSIKFYIQVQGVEQKPEQISTTNMNRVIATIDH